MLSFPVSHYIRILFDVLMATITPVTLGIIMWRSDLDDPCDQDDDEDQPASRDPGDDLTLAA
ncbi:MAG TPA: hypothetical protein VFW33_00440 [Gemmataceae bacterium]|nr:hypothetical protein [Gemmataceae bacterium]